MSHSNCEIPHSAMLSASSSSPEGNACGPWFEAIGAIMGSSGRGLLVTDNEGTICYTNERLSEIVGYSPDEMSGSNPRMFQSGRTAPNTYATLWNTVSSGRSWRSILQNRRKNRETFVEDITITPIVDRRGAITHFFGEISEIDVDSPTPRLRRPVEEMERVANISKGISHEINNVLMGIVGHCSLAKHRCELGDSALKRIDTIHSLAERLAVFSKKLSVCAGQQPVRAERIDLNMLVIEALDALEPVLDLKQVVTSVPDCPIVLFGDRNLLRLAVNELVRNALEARQPSGREILVTVSRSVWEGESRSEGMTSLDFGLARGLVAVLSVVDEGVGMELPLLEIAPELFFSTKLAHAGLGLPAVIGIARSHHGAFEVQSSVGKGTTARLYLPLALRFGKEKLPE